MVRLVWLERRIRSVGSVGIFRMEWMDRHQRVVWLVGQERILRMVGVERT
jgi:hypothetical protein